MSEQDVALVRSLYEAWFAGDTDSALAGLDAEIEWVEPPDAPESETHRGVEGVLFSTERWTEPFEHWTMEIEGIRDLDEGRVLVSGRQFGRGRGSSVEVEDWIFHLWTIRDGRAIRMEMFLTEPEALAAAAPSRPADGA